MRGRKDGFSASDKPCRISPTGPIILSAPPSDDMMALSAFMAGEDILVLIGFMTGIGAGNGE